MNMSYSEFQDMRKEHTKNKENLKKELRELTSGHFMNSRKRKENTCCLMNIDSWKLTPIQAYNLTELLCKHIVSYPMNKWWSYHLSLLLIGCRVPVVQTSRELKLNGEKMSLLDNEARRNSHTIKVFPNIEVSDLVHVYC